MKNDQSDELQSNAADKSAPCDRRSYVLPMDDELFARSVFQDHHAKTIPVLGCSRVLVLKVHTTRVAIGDQLFRRRCFF
jgi:hypothetical protein